MVVDILFKTTWWKSSQDACHHNYFQDFSQMYIYSASQKKRKPLNQVNFSENYNDLSKNVYIVKNLSLSSSFWHQIYDVLAMLGRARTISNGDVKIDLRRIGG